MQKMARDCCLTELAEALDVSRNGFHAHEHKDRGRRRRRDVHLLAAIQPLLVASRRTYGSPRITRALRQAEEPCGKTRVARLIREFGLRAKQKRRFRPRATPSAQRLQEPGIGRGKADVPLQGSSTIPTVESNVPATHATLCCVPVAQPPP